mgnify:CR=1 FL=1
MSKPVVRVVSAKIEQSGRYLLTQRLSKAVLPDLWEFPGGRVRLGESDADALVRAIEHRVGTTPNVGDLVLEVTHHYDNYSVVLAVYTCTLDVPAPSPKNVQAVAWVFPDDFADYPFPPADEATVHALVGALDG